jgi:hypothetical protein
VGEFIVVARGVRGGGLQMTKPPLGVLKEEDEPPGVSEEKEPPPTYSRIRPMKSPPGAREEERCSSR